MPAKQTESPGICYTCRNLDVQSKPDPYGCLMGYLFLHGKVVCIEHDDVNAVNLTFIQTTDLMGDYNEL